MDSRRLSSDALARVRDTLRPTRRYVGKLVDRMLTLGFPADDELQSSATRALAKLEALDRELIRARVSHRHAPHDPDREPTPRA